MKRIFFVALTILLFSLSTFAKPVILRDMRVQNLSQDMRATLYLSSSTQYRTFTLHNPTRFVVDLQNTRTYRRLQFPLHNPIVDFKYATHRDGIFRMVFGLNNRFTPIVHAMPPDQFHQARLQIIFPRFSSSTPSWLKHNVFLPQKKSKNITVEPIRKAVLTDTENNNQHRDVIIVVDPGHGGKDPGATGPGGTHEKTIVLSISKKIQRWIDEQPGYHALLTRTGDYYLTLRQRLRIARKDKADMFIAIHADTWRNKTAGGVSVFALSQKGATSEAARWLAARENASELMGGVDLQDKSHLLKSVLINLSQAATIRSSLEIGNDLLATIKPIAKLHHDRVEQAAFVVLKSPDIPSLLVETGFLSNPREERKLRNQTYQNKLAYAIMLGIRHYFSTHPPRDTWLSYWRHHPRNA